MKVVIFCGGLGARLKEYSDTVPKPMITIGGLPILWHVMKYYAHWGHTEFILCLGYRGEVIRQYFLGAAAPDDWRIRFVDTGLHASVGERLRAIHDHLDGDEVFLATYADGLTDLPLPRYLEFFERARTVATFVAVRPVQTFHVTSIEPDGLVSDLRYAADAGFWINGGFFVFRRAIFDYLGEGEDLVEEPFRRLIAKRQLAAYQYTGFWRCMDTFKDKQMLDAMAAAGSRGPWEIWNASC